VNLNKRKNSCLSGLGLARGNSGLGWFQNRPHATGYRPGVGDRFAAVGSRQTSCRHLAITNVRALLHALSLFSSYKKPLRLKLPPPRHCFPLCQGKPQPSIRCRLAAALPRHFLIPRVQLLLLTRASFAPGFTVRDRFLRLPRHVTPPTSID
jgi:hypothetical protein